MPNLKILEGQRPPPSDAGTETDTLTNQAKATGLLVTSNIQ